MIWEALSRFGMVGPDSLRVVEQTKEWAVSFRQTNHPLATVRRQISGLKAIANENDADDEALDWMQKRVTLIHATLEKLKKKPRVRAANRRLAVCCNERSTLPLFLLDGGHPIVGPSDDLCLWIRRGDKMYASICVDRDRRQRADWVDFVLDVMHHSDYSGEPLLSAPVGTWDVLVIDLDAPADRRTQSWAEVLMSHGVDADRIVYAAERDDSAAHNPDIVACAHDFQTLASFLEPMGVSFNDRFASIVLGCFGWSRAQMSRPFMRLAQKSEKTTEYTISEGTPVQIVS
jgi:hypothetical protein